MNLLSMLAAWVVWLLLGLFSLAASFGLALLYLQWAPSGLARPWGDVIAIGAGAVISLVTLVPFVRMTATLFPRRGSNRKRVALIGLFGLIGLTLVVMTLVSPAADPGLSATIAAFMGMYAGVCAMLIFVHARPLVGSRPSVLYLRKFGSGTDDPVLAAVLSGLPRRAQVLFLNPPLRHTRLTAWDPGLRAFAGWLPVLPFGRLQVAINENDWKPEIETLIQRLDAIVIDVSTPSASLDLELGRIHAAKAEDRTILVCHEKLAAKADALPLRAGAYVSFRTTYWRAVPWLLIALPATYICALVFAPLIPANAAGLSDGERIALVMVPVAGLVVAAMLRCRLDRLGSKRIRVELRRLLAGGAARNASP